MSAQNMAKYRQCKYLMTDLKFSAQALVLAMKEGKHYMARTAELSPK